MRAQVLLPKVFNFSFTYNTNKKKLYPGDVVEVDISKVGILMNFISED